MIHKQFTKSLIFKQKIAIDGYFKKLGITELEKLHQLFHQIFGKRVFDL